MQGVGEGTAAAVPGGFESSGSATAARTHGGALPGHGNVTPYMQ